MISAYRIIRFYLTGKAGEPGINVDRYLSGVKANVLRGLNVRISVVEK